MAAALLPFIYEDRLTGALYGGTFSRRGRSQPQLALGELLLRRRRLAQLLPELGAAGQQAQLAAIIEQQETVCREWSIHYQQKLQGELAWRGRRLRAFLQEQREEGGGMGGFAAEARRRTLAQELWWEQKARGFQEDAQESRRLLAAIDGELRSLAHPAPFRWDPVLALVYPRDEFWWLYASGGENAPRS